MEICFLYYSLPGYGSPLLIQKFFRAKIESKGAVLEEHCKDKKVIMKLGMDKMGSRYMRGKEYPKERNML